MIDDVQFIAGKESTQEEFFHTMNEIISAGAGWSSRRTARRRIWTGSSRASCRACPGAWWPTSTSRTWSCAQHHRAQAGAMPALKVPLDVQMFLAKRISSNVRELEGALIRVSAYAGLQDAPITIEFVSEVLANTLRHHQRRISIDEIQTKVSDHYRIRKAEMTSARRAREVARPRQVAMYLAKQMTQRSLPEIGRRFGGRDHTTVIHAVRQIEKLRAQDAELDADIRLLTRQLESS
jgi:chromosomal replication initiator protein